MASIMQLSSGMMSMIENAMKIIKNPQEVEAWVKTASSNIKLLEAALEKGDLNMGTKRHVETAIGRMKGFKVLLKAKHRVQGGSHQTKQLRSHRLRWEEVKSAFQGRIRTGVIINLKHTDPLTFLEDAFFMFAIKIKNALKDHIQIKVNTVFCGLFEKDSPEGSIEEIKHFQTKNAVIDGDTDLKEWWFEQVQDNLVVQLEDFQERESGWALKSIINLAVNINRYEPIRGSSYIPLPPRIARKHACINVKNDDEACFAWSVMSALYPPAESLKPCRVSSYPHYSVMLNLDGLRFPMTVDQIKKFEKLNAVSVNAFMLERSGKGLKVVPARLTKDKLDHHVNLLIIQNTYDEEADEDIKYHWCWIKNLSRLVSKQASNKQHKVWVCERCLYYFYSEERLKTHEIDCWEINECRVQMPRKEKNVVKFKNISHALRVPFIIYADFEALLKPIKKQKGKSSQLYQEHEAFSVGYYFHCSFDSSLSKYKSNRGADCRKWFVEELKQIVEDVEPVHWAAQPLQLSYQEEQDFRAATTCHICSELFDATDIKVRDHCHLTGKFRAASHQSCNINYQDKKIIPIVFHNLSGYDASFIIKDLALGIEGAISLLPINKTKYISFTKSIQHSEIKFRFIDSFRFMASSLDKLTSYLEELKIVREQFPDLDDQKFQLLTRKGVFPYEYLDSWVRLDEPQLPAKKHFFSKLKGEGITDDDYVHAQRIWQEFNCQTLGEYADLYMKMDVLLLADVFENFRDTSLKTYGLDAAHYVSAPGLTWDAMLKYTKVDLELITNIDQLLFVERGIRGGLSQCSNRYAKVNNKYIPGYDPRQPSSYLMYYDVNNLYGWAMSQCLPTGGFKWVNEVPSVAQIESYIMKVVDDSPKGYLLEIDVEYPSHLHFQHKDLPLLPLHTTAPESKQKKLMATLYNKERYVIHYRALKQALRYGLKLTKVHRLLEFNQSAWMKPYIELNTEMRKKARNEFEKNFYKLMNNSAFGKTMEDVRKRKVVKLVSKWDGRYSAKVKIAAPNFHSFTILVGDPEDSLVLIELNKTEVTMNKPVYVGMSVLDMSKTKLYEFLYDYLHPKYGPRCKVLYTDTDSLICHIMCEDIYADMKQDIHLFDTSDYSPDNRYRIPLVNKKILGIMKDENNGKVMTEFVGLRSKMYADRVEGKDATKKVKGVKGYVVKQTITFDDYIQCLRTGMELYRDQNCIRNLNHELYSIRQTKVALSSADDKRQLLLNTTDTLPWGYQPLQ